MTLDKSDFRKCFECKKIYQVLPIINKPFLSSITGKSWEYVWAKDAKNIEATICDRCGTSLGGRSSEAKFCRNCDRVMTVHKGCPRCGCSKREQLGFFDSLPHEYF